MTPASSFLLQLVRLGIHPDAELASAQKVKAIALDGYSRLLDAGMVTVAMDNDVKGRWLAAVYRSYEQRYPVYS